MDLYEPLRSQARQQRDKAIHRARAEYKASLKQIDALRARLCGTPEPLKQKAGRSIIEMVCDLLPRDKPFTFGDILKLLCEAEPGRAFNEQSARTILCKLESQGLVRRVSKNQSGRVLWAAAGSAVADSPYGAKPLTEVAVELLKESGPMSPTELVVALQEKGYRPDADPRQMVAALRNSARRYPGRFVLALDGRWSAADQE